MPRDSISNFFEKKKLKDINSNKVLFSSFFTGKKYPHRISQRFWYAYSVGKKGFFLLFRQLYRHEKDVFKEVLLFLLTF